MVVSVGIIVDFNLRRNYYCWVMRDLFEKLGLPRQPFIDPYEAREQASAALSVKPDDIKALSVRAKANLDVQIYDSAAYDYGHLIELQPDKAEWYEGRAQAWLGDEVCPRDPKNAMKDVEKAIALSGLNVRRILLRGKALRWLERKVEAKRDFDKILTEYKGDQIDLATYLELCDQYLAVFDGEGASLCLELASAKKDADEVSFHERQHNLAGFYLKRMEYEKAAKLYEALVALPDKQRFYSDLIYYANLLADKGDTKGSAKFKAESLRLMNDLVATDRYFKNSVDMSVAATLLMNLRLDGRQSDYDALVKIIMPKIKQIFEGNQSKSEYEHLLFYLLAELPKPKAKDLGLLFASRKLSDFCYDETVERLAEYVDEPYTLADKSNEEDMAATQLHEESLRNLFTNPKLRWNSSMFRAELRDPFPDPAHLSEQARRALRAGDKVSALKLALRSFALAPDESFSAATLVKVAFGCGDSALAKKGLETLLRHSQIEGDQAFMLYQLSLKEKKADAAAKYLRLARILGDERAVVMYRKNHKGLGVVRCRYR